MADYDANPKKIPIRTDVPVDMRGELIRLVHHEVMPPGSLGASVLEGAASTLDDLHESLAKVYDARSAALQASMPSTGSPQRPEQLKMTPQAAAALDQGMNVAFDRLAPRVDAAMTKVEEQIGLIRKAVDAKLVPPGHSTPAGVGIQQEIRSYVLGMKPGQRSEFAIDAVKRGDLTTVAALLSGPEYLSGLDSATRDLVRSQAAAKFAAAEWQQLQAAEKIIGHVEKQRLSFVERFAKARPKLDKKHTASSSALAALTQ